MRTAVRSGGCAGPVSPRSDRRADRHCAACAACPSLDSGTHGGPCRRAGSPTLGRRHAPGRKRRGPRRDRYRLGVIAEPTVAVTGGPRTGGAQFASVGPQPTGPGVGWSRTTPAGHSTALAGSPGLEPNQSGRRRGTDGPRPAPAAGLGRTGLPMDSDHASAGAAGRAPRTAGAGRRQPELGVKVSDRDLLCFG
jgi:hypothetical protein